MSRLIDADELKKNKTVLWDPALGFCECVLVEDIDNAPTVVTDNNDGHKWIDSDENFDECC